MPIALLVGLYMYVLRKGHVVEAVSVRAIGVLAATVAGNWIPGSVLKPYFQLSRNQTILAICAYGFIASVLPVWLLLCPRDYLSSFLKIGTIGLLVIGVIVANPQLHALTYNELYAGGGGPVLQGRDLPVLLHMHHVRCDLGLSRLVSSGTTPKMIGNEKDVRMIGYGAMLIEGLVAVMAADRRSVAAGWRLLGDQHRPFAAGRLCRRLANDERHDRQPGRD